MTVILAHIEGNSEEEGGNRPVAGTGKPLVTALVAQDHKAVLFRNTR